MSIVPSRVVTQLGSCARFRDARTQSQVDLSPELKLVLLQYSVFASMQSRLVERN